MHAWGLRLRRVPDRLAIAPAAVWPSVSWYDVGTPDAIISQLNTLPACAPVNASVAALRLATHDSGSGWAATPFLCDAFIHDSTPVYPGAHHGQLGAGPAPGRFFSVVPSTSGGDAVAPLDEMERGEHPARPSCSGMKSASGWAA
jgi:hypothetical protein